MAPNKLFNTENKGINKRGGEKLISLPFITDPLNFKLSVREGFFQIIGIFVLYPEMLQKNLEIIDNYGRSV